MSTNRIARETLGRCNSKEEVFGALLSEEWINPGDVFRYARERIAELHLVEAAVRAARKKERPEKQEPRGAVIEVIESGPGGQNESGVVKPNEVRINGVPVLCPADEFIEIEGLEYDPRKLKEDGLIVKLRVFARQVVIGQPR